MMMQRPSVWAPAAGADSISIAAKSGKILMESVISANPSDGVSATR